MQSEFEIIDNVCRFLAGMQYELEYITDPIDKRLDKLQIDFCKCLFLTGARYIEIKDRSHILEITTSSIKIQAAKGGNIYYVDNSGFPDSFFDYYYSNQEMYPTCRESSFTAFVLRAMYPYRLTAGQRPLIKHLFRYRQIRAMHRFGMSDFDIASAIGEAEVRNVQSYISRQINIIP